MYAPLLFLLCKSTNVPIRNPTQLVVAVAATITCALQVHEIEPGYSREDFVLPGRVGFITEVGRFVCALR